MKNKTFNIIILLITTGIMLYFFVLTNGFWSFIEHLKYLDLHWIFLAVISIISAWLFEAGTLYVITRAIYKGKFLFLASFRITMIGQFFGAFTPFSSGSQPAQIYAMTEMGMPIGSAGSILIIKFLIHQLIYLFYLTLSLIFRFYYFNSKIKYFIQFCFLGSLINITMIVSLFIFSINNKIPKRVSIFTIKILKKVKLIKVPEKNCERIECEFTKFHNNTILIIKNKKMCIYAMIHTFFQLTSYYIVPYFIYRSFGFNSADVFTMITAQVFLTMLMAFIPIPGAEGGAEAGFYVIYGIFFKLNTIMSAIFIWRMITYYMKIAVGSIFTIAVPSKSIKTTKKFRSKIE